MGRDECEVHGRRQVGDRSITLYPSMYGSCMCLYLLPAALPAAMLALLLLVDVASYGYGILPNDTRDEVTEKISMIYYTHIDI